MSREFSRYHVEWRSVGLGGLVVVAGCGLLAGCGAPGDAADGLDGDDARQEEAASMDAPRPPPAESLMHGDTLVDMRDGRDYATVLIREQRWMAGNLRYQPPDASGWFCYDDDPLLCEELGALYAWNTARSACPPGWHLPTESEWDRLVDGVGGYTERTGEPGGGRCRSSSRWRVRAWPGARRSEDRRRIGGTRAHGPLLDVLLQQHPEPLGVGRAGVR